MKTKRHSSKQQARRVAKALRHILNELRQTVGEETAIVSLEATVAVPRRKKPLRRQPDKSPVGVNRWPCQ